MTQGLRPRPKAQAKDPRPIIDFPGTDPFEAEDRNPQSHGQGSRTQRASVFKQKKIVFVQND